MIKKGKYIVVLFVLMEIVGYSQSNTRGIIADTSVNNVLNPSTGGAPAHKILLIPFYSKMCMSEIGKDVNASTHLSFDEITAAFRSQLDMAMYNAMRRGNTVISLLQGKYKSDSVLGYIYGSTGYKYDLVPGTVVDIGAQDKNKNGRYVQKGQIEVPVDYSKRFMNVTISNPHLLGNLYKRYHADTYVFINELDIKNVANQTDDLNADTYRREVDVHYSIMDKDGKEIAKGLATTYFPLRQNDPKEIGEKYFVNIANFIYKDYTQQLLSIATREQQKNQVMQSQTTPPIK
jgi:hypothetical protein